MLGGIRLRYRAKLDASTQPKADRDQDSRPGSCRCLAQAGREAAQQSANSQKPDYTIWIATSLLERSTAFNEDGSVEDGLPGSQDRGA